MIINNGEKWVAPKYKITQTIVIYDDEVESYEDATIEENELTKEQMERLKEIEFMHLTEHEARNYVITGEGELPDRRSDIDKLIDLVPDDKLTEDIANMAPDWVVGMFLENGSYVMHDGSLCRSVRPHVTSEPPSESNPLYEVKCIRR